MSFHHLIMVVSLCVLTPAYAMQSKEPIPQPLAQNAAEILDHAAKLGTFEKDPSNPQLKGMIGIIASSKAFKQSSFTNLHSISHEHEHQIVTAVHNAVFKNDNGSFRLGDTFA